MTASAAGDQIAMVVAGRPDSRRRRGGRSPGRRGRGPDPNTRARRARGTSPRARAPQRPSAASGRWWRGRCPRTTTGSGRGRRASRDAPSRAAPRARPSGCGRPRRRAARRCGRAGFGRRAASPIARARSGVSAATWAATSAPSRATSTSVVLVEEQLEPDPGVGDQAGAGAGRLEDAGRGRVADARHRVAGDVQHGRRARC